MKCGRKNREKHRGQKCTLFSYFETPKHMVNIRQMEAQSDVIDGWTEADPESHFDREKAGGENFRILPALFSAGGEAEE